MKMFTPASVAVCVAVSVLCHASVSVFFAETKVDDMLDGGVQGDVAVIGTSFADMVSKDNMIARADPDKTAQAKPEPLQPEETTNSAEPVTDTDTTQSTPVKPTPTKPSETVKVETVTEAAPKAVPEPPVKSVAPLPTATPPEEHAPHSKVVKAAQAETTSPKTVNADAVPLASQPRRTLSKRSPTDIVLAQNAAVQDSAPKPDRSHSATVTATKSAAAPAETLLVPPANDAGLNVENQIEKTARSDAQTPMKAQDSVTPITVVAAKPVSVAAVSASRPPVVANASVAAASAVINPPRPHELSGTIPAARLVPEIAESPAIEAANSSDVAPDAKAGLPAPRVRPPQPDDGKMIARAPKRTVQKSSPKKTRTKAKKSQPAATGKQSQTQRSAQNDSGKSSVTASRGGGSGSKAKAAGNAKASNYPGLVYRKIQRTRQKRVGGRGSVRIRFSVSSSGGLVGISVAKSSGSSKIDQAALAHIRRAAPFPRPPKGARRSFTIPIDIRR